jgi:SAM-dependent methyltransferase
LQRIVRQRGKTCLPPQLRHAIATYQTPNHLFQHIAKGALPFADGSFDAITIIELIEHLAVAEIDAMLSEARRVLAPGGRLFLSTPNYGSFWPILEKIVNKVGDVSYEHQHITRFTKTSFTDVFLRNGYEVEKVEAYHFSAPFFAAINWWLANKIEELEPHWVVNTFGNLLFGIGRKKQ